MQNLNPKDRLNHTSSILPSMAESDGAIAHTFVAVSPLKFMELQQMMNRTVVSIFEQRGIILRNNF